MNMKGEQNLLLTDTTQLQSRYQLKSRLGANGGKQTWLAEDIVTHTEVTVKALYFGQGMEWQDLKLFEREAQTLKSLTHPNIPRYCDSFWLEKPEGNYFCLVQAYIPGVSLAQKVNSGWRLEEGEIVRVATSILEILIYLHRQNPPVIHRDIKPNNLIWGEDDQIYLVDFGAVQAEVTSGRTMTVVGTYGYMPPEQFGGRTVPASDLYGLGTTLLFLLTGTNPGDLPQKDLKIWFQDKIQTGKQLKQWLEFMIEPSLDRRFQSAKAALSFLERESNPSPVETVRVDHNGETLGATVRLERNSEQLNIEIHGRSFNSSDFRQSLWIFMLLIPNLLFLLCILIVSGSTSFYSFIGYVSLMALLSYIVTDIWPILVRTRIYLNRSTYEIIWGIEGEFEVLFHRRFKGLTKDLAGVKVRSKSKLGKQGVCVLCSHTKQHSFGDGLNPVGRRWLADKIESWLKQSETGA
jgi:serine/threonine protein kinase